MEINAIHYILQRIKHGNREEVLKGIDIQWRYQRQEVDQHHLLK
jgi:hypothetical protein